MPEASLLALRTRGFCLGERSERSARGADVSGPCASMVIQAPGPVLQHDLERIAQDGSIRTAPLLSGPAARALREAIALVQDTTAQLSLEGVRMFKICICYDPVRRWRGEAGSYVREGYDYMQLLMWSTATECRKLESQVIDHFHRTHGCQNQARGGGGMADSANMCYCYVAVADVSDPQWGLRRLKRQKV